MLHVQSWEPIFNRLCYFKWDFILVVLLNGFVMVLNGWAEFEYEGEGVRRIEKGDVLNQRPGIKHREIACSKDFEVLEIVSPANFETRIVDAPDSAEAAE